MVQRQRLQVEAEPPARTQPLADLADDPLAGPVVPDEGDVSAALLAGLGLAEVVQHSAEAKRAAAGDLVRQRLGEQLRGSPRLLADEARQLPLEPKRVLEHRQRMTVDVE